jgi:hypothetical protein
MAPRPQSIEPAVAYGTVATRVVIRGDGFYARGVQLASGGSAVDAHQRAWLGGFELGDVTWVDVQTLRAVVPPGLAPGTYDLVVENALGDRGAGPGLYRVVAGSPAVLRASVEAPPVANLGQLSSVSVTVANDGDAAALGVACELSAAGPGALALLSAPLPADVPARSARTFTWSFQASGLGDVALALQGAGADGGTGADVQVPAAGATVSVVRPAALAVQIVSAPARVNVGQGFDATVRVENTGDSAAAATTLVLALPNAVPDSAAVAVGAIAGGTWQDVTRSFTAAAPGATSLSASAAATDATDGTALAASASSPVQVQRPAALSATLSLPTPLALGDFTATLTVVNTGDASALGVAPPDAPLTLESGTAAISYVSGPAGAPVDLLGGQEAAFGWVYHVASVGTVQMSATVGGTDATSGAALWASSTSNVAMVPEVEQLASDPFADGTPFSYVTEYQGRLWLGPRADGAAAASMALDGSAPQTVPFAFPKDVVASGVRSANGWALAPPFPSIGALGCATNTSACGPDDENGRGFFTSVTLGGTEWLVAVGAKPGGNLHYVYVTPDAGSPLPFRYVDLSQQLSGETRTMSSIAALADRLYLGFPGKGGQSPFLLVLTNLPSGTGIDPVDGAYATSLGIAGMPYLGASGTPKNGSAVILVDALAAFSGRLYLANNGGFARSTNGQPRPYATAPSDWTTCTPTGIVKTAITTTKQSDLMPADKAVPQLAMVGGRLLAIRNVYLSGTSGAVGGQLWSCTPTALDAADALPQCATIDWALVVPDGGGDGRAAATVLVASARYLYLGFDRVGGARVFRTANPNPSSLADFTGQGGCVAGSTGCQGLGGDGFGDSANARFLDARVVSDAQGRTAAYLSVGDPSATPPVPIRVYRIPE